MCSRLSKISFHNLKDAQLLVSYQRKQDCHKFFLKNIRRLGVEHSSIRKLRVLGMEAKYLDSIIHKTSIIRRLLVRFKIHRIYFNNKKDIFNQLNAS